MINRNFVLYLLWFGLKSKNWEGFPQTSQSRKTLAVILRKTAEKSMNIENLSTENKIKLIIAEQTLVFKEKQDFESVEKRLNMLDLHTVE